MRTCIALSVQMVGYTIFAEIFSTILACLNVPRQVLTDEAFELILYHFKYFICSCICESSLSSMGSLGFRM